MKLERIVLYDHARPDASREVLLGDKLTCRLNQNLDDFERATPDRDRHSTRSQLAPSEIDLPLAHLIHQSSALCAHSQPLFRISHVSSKFGGAQAGWGRFRRWPTTTALCVEVADLLPGKASPFLRNIQACL